LSLDPDERDADYDAAWTAELEARLAKTEGNEFEARDAKDVLAEMRQALTKGPTP
jgi:hypothetical protein